MIYYFFLFLLFFLFAKIVNVSNPKREKIWITSLFCLFLILGSRYYIGGDYFGYMNLYNKMGYTESMHTITHNMEFFYYSIIFISNKIGINYFFTNFILIFILIFFFQSYAKNFTNPFFVLLISLPILFIPISINFVRQGIAISIFLYSIQHLTNGRYYKYCFLIFTATMFHKFAIIYMLFYFVYEKNFLRLFRYIMPLSLCACGLIALSFFVDIPLLSTWVNKILWHIDIYSDNTYPILPKGGIFRLLLICFSFFLLIYFREFFKKYEEYKVWFVTGLIGIILIPISYFLPFLGSRIIIFFVPISIFIFGHIICIQKFKKLTNVNVISFCFFLYFIIWINFSPFKDFFTPYKSILFL